MGRMLLLIFLVCFSVAGVAETIPVLYSTDLYHPHGDPDDHYDLMTLFALPEFDVRGVVLDADPKGKYKPAVCAIEQMQALTGRKIRFAVGLAHRLDSPEDTGEKHPAGEQAAVKLILDVLSEANQPITIFTTGSLRDMAAAYNRAPGLFKEKVGRFYINIGWVGAQQEWNVGLDADAYVRILTSDLPLFWCPCFGENNWQTYWKFRQGDVLEKQPAPIQNFFLYMLGKLEPEKAHPVAYLRGEIDEVAAKTFYGEDRNMWCTGPFLHAAGRDSDVFEFAPLTFTVDKGGTTIPGMGQGAITRQTFRIIDPERYTMVMAETLRDLYANLLKQGP